MASSTANLGLRKPAVSENWSVQDDFNANMQKIDDKFGAVSGTVKENLDALNSKLQGTRIFSNPSRTMSGAIQTTESITNYRWLLFIWKTNAEYVSELLPAFSNMVAHKSISAGAWDSTNNRFAYNAWCGVVFSGTTGATVTSGYNNPNFQMGIYEIWGIG